MTTIHTADDYAVEQVPIELIEPGDVIITTMRGGTPYVWEVDASGSLTTAHRDSRRGSSCKRREKPTYTTLAWLRAPAPVGTLTHRIIRRH